MTSVSKNVYIDKLDDLVSDYNNLYHRTIQMKPVDVKDNTYIDLKKEVNDKDPIFKVGDHVRISKYKTIFAKGYTSNQSEEVFAVSKIKNTVPQTYVIIISMMKKLLEHFMKKNYRRLINKNLEWKKYLGEKVINYMSNRKVMTVHLIVGLIKEIQCVSIDFNSVYKMSQYFPKSYDPFGGDINVKVELSNIATKSNIKIISHVDT